MREPSIRNVAVLPVVSVAAGLVIVLGTVTGQGASASQDCGPGQHSMASMDHGSSSGDSSDMAGMDHSEHMAMGGSSGCMDGPAMTSTGESTPVGDDGSMPGMDHGDMPGMDHGDMPGMDHGKAAEKAKKSGSKSAASKKATGTSGEAKAR